MKIENQIMYQVIVQSVGQCAAYCLMDDRCQSINFYVMTSTCDINKYSASVAPTGQHSWGLTIFCIFFKNSQKKASN